MNSQKLYEIMGYAKSIQIDKEDKLQREELENLIRICKEVIKTNKEAKRELNYLQGICHDLMDSIPQQTNDHIAVKMAYEACKVTGDML